MDSFQKRVHFELFFRWSFSSARLMLRSDAEIEPDNHGGGGKKSVLADLKKKRKW